LIGGSVAIVSGVVALGLSAEPASPATQDVAKAAQPQYVKQVGRLIAVSATFGTAKSTDRFAKTYGAADHRGGVELTGPPMDFDLP
jgi:hypothetical protein